MFAGNVLVYCVVYKVMTLRTILNYFIVNRAKWDMFLPANLFDVNFFIEKIQEIYRAQLAQSYARF